MNVLTNRVLPILLLAGVAFGLSYLTNYTGVNTDESENRGGVKGPLEPPLRFGTMNAEVSPSTPYLRYWDPDVEVGSTRFFDFWCENRHDQPVAVSVPWVNCQCSSAQLAVVEPADFADYESRLVLGALLGPQPAIWDALAAYELSRKLNWIKLNMKAESSSRTELASAAVPASNKGIPQRALLRFSWTGKGEPTPRTVKAEVNAQLPDGTLTRNTLVASFHVVPSFSAIASSVGGTEISFGELAEGNSQTREVVVWSATRPAMDVSIALNGPVPTDPNLTWTPFERVPDSEYDRMGFSLSNMLKKLVRVKSAYRTRVTLTERREVLEDGKSVLHQMDMGPFDRLLVLSQGAETINLPMKAVIRGDIGILGGPKDIDRIDLGQTFKTDQGKLKEVILFAEKPLSLELLKDQTVPPYLEVELTPLGTVDGKSQWNLKLRVPPGKLVGALPRGSAIILQTTDAAKRKIRIPIIGQAFDSGSKF